VEASLPTGAQVATWEQITEVIGREKSFAVGTCACRHEKKLSGDPCRIDAPRDACVYFGKVADFMIERGMAKRYSKEQLLDLLETCEDYGLVHNINNFLGDNIVLCNCCGCCCNFLVRMKKYRGLKQVAGSNFAAAVDPETCTGCGDCLDRCQMEALELEGETARVIEASCLGCGNCISACPSGSLSLARSAEVEPPKKPEQIVGLGV
jgi:NAD-dependent dihydropyrimidine dehydrogenase PreA subunit